MFVVLVFKFQFKLFVELKIFAVSSKFDLRIICKIKNHMQPKEKKSTYMCGVRGVMVIVAGNGHGDTSSNLGRD